MSDPTIYATVDLYLAAFFVARGIKLVDTEKTNRRTTFLFENSQKVKQLAKDFCNNEKVGATTYKNALRDLKAIIYNM
ncbi:hypothetical protein ES702_01296 [subsurface metagenome]